MNCVKSSKNSAQSLLNTIVSEFSCFKDEAVYKGKGGIKFQLILCMIKYYTFCISESWFSSNNISVFY